MHCLSVLSNIKGEKEEGEQEGHKALGWGLYLQNLKGMKQRSDLLNFRGKKVCDLCGGQWAAMQNEWASGLTEKNKAKNK
jgi:hypothetical protein